MTAPASENPDGMTVPDVAAIFGVTIDDVFDELDRPGGFQIPDDWWRTGRRRRAEYEAWTGRSDIKGAAKWWAAKDAEQR